ncbi:hypothetical protein [Stygiolobus caldivivus]|uniref:Flagellin n=1 Tax=Stygiolobus caldivivus TaxID=2824673 RepID=A0A8D5ZHP7_9CREN|nr:hypothetical protein [Stygiolobus caldivivus]BCU68896.1 hypothetical protein KN1_01930 [Stygiolobus caldivivus]
MESPLAVMILLIGTILVALVAFAFSSVYSSYVANNAYISNFAESVSEGLYITKSTVASSGPTYSVVIVPEDFNYNGTIYLTAVNTTPVLYGSDVVAPNLGDFDVKINGTIPAFTNNVILYSTSLHELYQGSIPLWKSTVGAPQTITIPVKSDAVVFIFIQTPKGLVEVGYVWLED